MDKLVKKDTYFDRVYTVNTTCIPNRVSLITRKYSSQHCAWSLGTKLSECEVTLGQCLQKEGYRTTLVGKVHFQQKFLNEDLIKVLFIVRYLNKVSANCINSTSKNLCK